MKADKINVACPHCGHVQLEPREGYSTVCKKCRQHFRLEEVLHPKAGPEEKHHATRQVTCFQCQTLLDVAAEAESTMCKRCSAHIDLRNYNINQAVSKNFRTHGSFVVGEKGYVFNTEAEVGDAVIRGKFLGKIHAHRTLTLYAPTEFKGTFKAGLLVVPEGIKLLWTKPLDVNSVEIAGELVSNVQIPGTVILKATGHLFGDVEAANLIMEPGAVLVGQVKIGSRSSPTAAPPAFSPSPPPDLPVPASPPPAPEPQVAEPVELPGLEVKPRPAKRKSPAKPKKQG
jgi:cytoskeletal protein CcmA (bactofilin family)